MVLHSLFNLYTFYWKHPDFQGKFHISRQDVMKEKKKTYERWLCLKSVISVLWHVMKVDSQRFSWSHAVLWHNSWRRVALPGQSWTTRSLSSLSWKNRGHTQIWTAAAPFSEYWKGLKFTSEPPDVVQAANGHLCIISPAGSFRWHVSNPMISHY